MRALTAKENDVLTYLQLQQDGKWTSPTKIGHDIGGGNRHSAWASPICLRLVKLGLVLRHDCGWYKVKGQWVKEGIEI